MKRAQTDDFFTEDLAAPKRETKSRPRRAQPRSRSWLTVVSVVLVIVALLAAGLWLLWPQSTALNLRRLPVADLTQNPTLSDQRASAVLEVPDGFVMFTRTAEQTAVALWRGEEQVWQQQLTPGLDWQSVEVVDATEAGAYAVYFSTTAPGAAPSGPAGAGDASVVFWLAASDGSQREHKQWPATLRPAPSRDGRFYSVDLRNGELTSWQDLTQQRWSASIPDYRRGDPAPRVHRSGSTLAVTANESRDLTIQALLDRDTGKRLSWQVPGLAYLTNAAVVGVTEGKLTGYGFADGTELWTVPWEGEAVRVAGGELFLTSQAPSGEVTVVAIDAASGRTRWENPLRTAQWIEVVGEDLVVRSDAEIFLGDLESGQGNWLPSSPGETASLGRDPIIGENMYYCVGLDDQGMILTARSRSDGSELWNIRSEASLIDDIGGQLWGTGLDETGGLALLK